MTYEWGYAYGLPMAVAPLPQVAQVVRYAVTEIPPGKIQLGIPNYGYDGRCPIPPAAGPSPWATRRRCAWPPKWGRRFLFDETAQTPTFSYTKEGRPIGFGLRMPAACGKLRLALEWKLGAWPIGTCWPFAQNWAILGKRFGPTGDLLANTCPGRVKAGPAAAGRSAIQAWICRP